MILLRKKDAPEVIKDYRPISLIHSFSKLVAKCLANRLAKFLHSLVSPNQSAFIRGRCIHDNFRSVQLACRYLHSVKRPSILLKVDIAKAFDTVSWSFLLEILEFMGFGRRWRDWISALLSTASTKILLNGRPGARICHARGLRQGDPLSPMLFVLVMEVLNGLIRFADQNGYLSHLPSKAAGCRASLYADDLVVFLAPVQGDVDVMKEMLRIFGHASGLFTNMDKSVATPIQCSTEQLQLFVSRFGCQIAHFPCRYLGVPLSVHKLSRSEELPLINSVANIIPAWKGNLLNIAGRATLTVVTLSAIPTHTTIAVCLSPWAVQQIDKKRRAFLWCAALRSLEVSV